MPQQCFFPQSHQSSKWSHLRPDEGWLEFLERGGHNQNFWNVLKAAYLLERNLVRFEFINFVILIRHNYLIFEKNSVKVLLQVCF